MRGTFHGTWQSSGGCPAGLFLAVASTVAVAAAVDVLLSLLWIIAVALGVVVAAGVGGLVLIWRWNRSASANFAAQCELRHAAQQLEQASRPCLPAAGQGGITVHVHDGGHLHLTSGQPDYGLPVLRLPETSIIQVPEGE